MIKLNKINKYFNYRKRNEIHVLNNIELEFPKKGLVCILGASGSGKTTLLNVIGGLDSFKDGNIEINDLCISNYNDKIINQLRSQRFGYIFQNYLLISDLTVYENLEFVLKNTGLSKEEIENRIDYVLHAVSMDKFRYRYPNELSGGQQQRVAIARALIKSPEVIIADEPTGNLDFKNTTQVMKILKKVSLEYLVILVTHEKRLVDAYADRVIEIKDGKIINDYINQNNEMLLDNFDNNIYLKEYELTENEVDNVVINYYHRSGNKDDKIVINIICDNNYLFIDTKAENREIKFISNKNDIKIINSKKPQKEKVDVEKVDYYLPKINYDDKFSLSISFLDSMKIAAGNLKKMKFIYKIMMFIFFFTSLFVAAGFTFMFDLNHVDEDDFLNYPRETLYISKGYNYFTSVELNEIRTLSKSDLLVPHFNLCLSTLSAQIFYQKRDTISFDYNVPVFPNTFEDVKLLIGRLPSSPYEMVIDSYLANRLLKLSNVKSAGIKSYNQFIGLTHQHRNVTYYIVGVIDDNNPCLYLTYEGYKLLEFNYHSTQALQDFRANIEQALYKDVEVTSYTLFDDSIEMTENLKDLKLQENQILVSSDLYFKLKGDTIKLYETTFNIVGTYVPKYQYEISVYFQEKQLNKFYDGYIQKNKAVRLISEDKETVYNILKENGYQVKDLYLEQYQMQRNNNIRSYQEFMYFILIVVILSLLFLYFIMKGSVSHRTFQIGVFRSLGVNRLSIVKIFLSEIFLISLFTSLASNLLICYITFKINEVMPLIYYTFLTPLSAYLIYLMLNCLIGIIPLIKLLRLTPSQIISRFDI